MFVSYDHVFPPGTGFEVRHETEFTSEAGEALRLTVRQSVKSKASLKQLAHSILVFDFQRADAISAESSPTAARPHAAPAFGGGADAAPAAAAAQEVAVEEVAEARAPAGERTGEGGKDGGRSASREEGGGAARGTAGPREPLARVVFAHDRNNGAKQLYVNRALVYSIKKDCTDGNLNSWVLPLPFGRAVLRLTGKLFSSSGFLYTLTLGVGKGGAVLYKSTR